MYFHWSASPEVMHVISEVDVGAMVLEVELHTNILWHLVAV